MRIAVFGSAAESIENNLKEFAGRIGAEIANREHVLIMGAMNGLPYDAALAASDLGGKVIGYSPATSLEQHKAAGWPTKGLDLEFLPEDCELFSDLDDNKGYRIVRMVTNSDAVIIISGRSGTLLEYSNSLRRGKIIGVLQNSGGITENTIPYSLDEAIRDDVKTDVFYDIHPEPLVIRAERIFRNRTY